MSLDYYQALETAVDLLKISAMTAQSDDGALTAR